MTKEDSYIAAGLDEMDIQLLTTPLRIILTQPELPDGTPDYSFLRRAVRAKDKVGEFYKSEKTPEWRAALMGFTKDEIEFGPETGSTPETLDELFCS